MAEPWFRFPVACPECRREELASMQISGVAAALLKGDRIQLYTSCHDIYWEARPVEVEQIREYLGVAGTIVQTVPGPIPELATDLREPVRALVARGDQSNGRTISRLRRALRSFR